MAGAADTRIMEMQFENREFEKNIAKSQRSVEDLKKAMDFEETSSGLEKFSNGIKGLDFSKFSDNIQKLTDKFTGLGTVGELVLSQIRRKIEETAAKVSNFVDSMTTAQVSAGMDKYSMLNKSVQTIKAATGKSEEEVYSVLERLNKYTDQTSYNFSDMAKNIGKFTSVGIDLAPAEKQMEGIANWAARSGSGINEASRAMYNLSQAMGVGKLTLIDWKSIENAGMATKEFKEQLMEAAVEAGTLEKKVDKATGKATYKTAKSLGKQEDVSYQNVGSTLNKGWATSAVISKTLEKYYYEDLEYENDAVIASFAKLNEEQKKAFSEMIENDKKLDATELETLEKLGVMTKDAKESILELAVSQGKLTKETDDAGKSIYAFTDKSGKKFAFTIDEMGKSLDSGWFDKNIYDAATGINNLARESYEAAQKCQTFSDVLGAWKDQISTGWMNSLKTIFGELSESMIFFSDVCNRVGEGLDFLISLRNGALESWASAGGRDSLIDLLLGNYGENEEAGVYGLLDILDSAKDLLYGGFVDFMSIFAGGDEKELMKTDPEYFSSWLGVKLSEVTNNIKSFIAGIKTFFDEDIEVNGKVKSRLEVIQDVVRGIAGALSLAYQIVTNVIGFIRKEGKELQPSIDAIMGFFGDLGMAVFGTAESMNAANKFKKFFEDLSETLKPVTDGINTVVNSIVNFFRKILDLDEEGANFSGVFDSIGSVLLKVADIISKIVGPILTFVSTIIDSFSKLFEEGISAESIGEFGKNLSEGFSRMMMTFADSLPDSFGFLKDWINKLFGGATNLASKEATETGNGLIDIVGGLSSATETALEAAARTDGQGISYLGLLFSENAPAWSLALAIISISVLIQKAGKLLKSITGFFGGLGETTKSIGEALKDGIKIKYNDESFAAKFLKIAESVGIIAAAIFVLGKMPLNSLIQGGIAIVAVMALAFGLFKLLAANSKKGNYKDQIAFSAQLIGMASGLMIFALAIGILTLALIPFTLMSWEQYGKAMAGLAGILLTLVGFMALTKKLASTTDSFKFTGIIAFAFGIAVLMLAVRSIAKLSLGQLAIGIGGLVAVLLALIGFMRLMQQLQLSTFGLNFKRIIAFVLSISILMLAVKSLSGLSVAQLATGVGGLVAVLLALIGFMRLMQQLQLSTFGLNFKGIITFVLSISVLMLAVKSLSGLSVAQLAIGVGGLVAVLLALIGFMRLMQQLQLSTFGLNFKGIITFVLSISILMLAVKSLSGLSVAQLATSVGGLAAVLLVLIGFMFLMKKLTLGTDGLQFSGIMAFVISISVLMFALKSISSIPIGQLMTAVLALGLVLAELAGFMGLTKLLGADSGSLSFDKISIFVAAIALLVNSLLPLAKLEWNEVLNMAASFGLIIALFYIALELLSRVKVDTKSILPILLVGAILAIIVSTFASSVEKVKDVKIETLIAFAGGLSVLILAISVAAAIAAVIGPKGFLILAVGLAAIAAVIALVAPLLINSISGALRDAAGDLAIMADLMETFSSKMGRTNEGDFDKAERIFGKVKNLLTSLFGIGIVKGSATAFMDMMGRLSLAASEIVKFRNKIFSAGPDGGAVMASFIVASIKSLFENDLVGFNSYVGVAQNFYDAIFKLSSGIDYFRSMTSSVGNPDENNGLKLIKELAGCADDLNTIYAMDLKRFQDNLAGLGGAMLLYAEGAASMNANGTEIDGNTDISGAMLLIKKISETIAQEGGVTIPSNMPAENELTGFGVQLAALAGALVAFEQAGAGLGNGTQQALNTLDFFSALKMKLSLMNLGTDLSSAISSFKDENGDAIRKDELIMFGEDIAALGSAMAHFASSTQAIDENTGEIKQVDFTKATSALESIAKLPDLLPTDDGLLEIITGRKTTLTDLSVQIELIGDALHYLYIATSNELDSNSDSVKAYKEMDFTNVTNFLTSVSNLDLPVIKPLGGLFDGGQELPLGEFGSQIAVLGSGLKTFIEKVEPYLTSGENGKDKMNAPNAIDFTPVTTFLSSIADVQGKLIENENSKVKEFNLSNIFNNKDTQLSDLGGEIGKLGQGLGEYISEIGKYTNNDFSKIPDALKFDGVGPFLQSIIDLEKQLVFEDKIEGFTYDGLFVADNGSMTLGSLGGEIGKLGSGLNEFIAGVKGDQNGSVTAGAFKEENTKPVFDLLNSMIDFMGTIATKLPKVGGISNVLSSLWSGTSANLKTVGDSIGELGSGLEAFATKVNGKFKNKTELTNVLNLVEGFVKIASELTKAMDSLEFGGSSFGYYASELNDFITNLANGAVGDVPEARSMPFFDTLISIIDYVNSKLSELDGLDSGRLEMFNAFTNSLANLASIDLTEKGIDFQNIGLNIDAGIATGISNGTSTVIDAAVAMALAAYNAARGALGIESPSRVFMGIGNYLGLGMAAGIDSSAGYVVNSATGMSEQAIESAGNVMATIGRLMAEDTDANPVVAPVLDMTNLNNGMAAFDQSLDGKRMNLDASVSAGYAGRVARSAETASEYASSQNRTDYSGIYEHMNQMGVQIASLGESIRNMKLYLDSGILAGGVTDDVDRNIGRKQFYFGRRN